MVHINRIIYIICKEKMEERDDIVVLNDEEGNEVEFEYLTSVELNGKEFICLIPLEESDEGDEVVILEIRPLEGDEVAYYPVETEEELQEVYEEFKKAMGDDFDFI